MCIFFPRLFLFFLVLCECCWINLTCPLKPNECSHMSHMSMWHFNFFDVCLCIFCCCTGQISCVCAFQSWRRCWRWVTTSDTQVGSSGCLFSLLIISLSILISLFLHFPPLQLFNLSQTLIFIFSHFLFHAVILLCSDFSLNLSHSFLPLEHV